MTEEKDHLSEEQIEEWFDLEEEVNPEGSEAQSQSPEEKYSNTQLRVVRSSIDYTLHTLKDAFSHHNYINLSPDYQRRGRWDAKKRSLLIESFLLNVPIPPLYLYESDYNQYEVMDGRQRLETISEFLDNGFPLTGLEFWSELNGKRFRDIPSTIQRGLLRRTISAIVLLAETAKPKDDFDIRMVLFRRLNTGGVKLNPQELRNALYPSLFNDAIRELSREDSFTSLWNIPKKTENEHTEPSKQLLNNALYKSMMDCELVLRFFAIRETITNDLKGSLKSILDKTMKSHERDNKEEIESLKLLFLNSLHRLTNALGYNFNELPSTGRASRPLYDALMVGTSLLPDLDLTEKSEKIKIALEEAVNNPEKYEILVGRGNTIEAVKDRISLAMTIISQ